MAAKITYWGVRGSLPSSGSPQQNLEEIREIMTKFFASGYREATQIKEFLSHQPLPKVGGFGTATTCVEIESQRNRIIIDGGSGLRALGEKVMLGPCGKGQGVVHIFLTHFHWDHLLGIPFFTPLFLSGNQINFYAVQPDLEELVRGKFRRPYFPVAFESLPSKINFHYLPPRKPFFLDDFRITPYQLDHPDPCWGFKVEVEGRAYAHCVDTEGTRVSREDLGPDLPLYQGIDLMYYDAQYTLPELAEKANWGHSAAQLGLDLAFREGIKRVVFAHHDPGASTAQLYTLIHETQDYYEWKLSSAKSNQNTIPKVEWQFAHEGLQIIL